MSYPEAVWERAMKVQEVIMKTLIGELHWHRRPILWVLAADIATLARAVRAVRL